MEIKRYVEEYKKNSPREFYNWISKGRTMEVRFLSDRNGNKFNQWDIIKRLSEHFKIESRFNSLYINSYDDLTKILLVKYEGLPLTKQFNIFIGVNPRRKVYIKTKAGLLKKSYYGGIAGTSHIQNILCDIEHRLRGKTRDKIIQWMKEQGLSYDEKFLQECAAPNASESMIEECLDGAKHLVAVLGLTNYAINISGNGTHLWFPLEEPIELQVPSFREFTKNGTPQIKYNLKEEPIYGWIKTYNHFIEQLDDTLQKFNPKLKVDDGAKDIARIARHPGSWNVKAGKIPRQCGTVIFNKLKNNIINQKFSSAKHLYNKDNSKLLKTAEISSKYRYNTTNLRSCPLVKLLLSGMLPSILSRNHYLEQSLARILRDNQISVDQISDLINEIDSIQGKSIQVDPDYLDGDEPFNSESINSYCIGCKIDLVYPILEEIPDVTEDLIDASRYKALNNYSWQTVENVAVVIKDKPRDYLALKALIRNLSDIYTKADIFFAVKLLYRNEWDYMDRNKVIQQILNKTRPRISNRNI